MVLQGEDRKCKNATVDWCNAFFPSSLFCSVPLSLPWQADGVVRDAGGYTTDTVPHIIGRSAVRVQ
jgi:hypothetical protein